MNIALIDFKIYMEKLEDNTFKMEYRLLSTISLPWWDNRLDGILFWKKTLIKKPKEDFPILDTRTYFVHISASFGPTKI